MKLKHLFVVSLILAILTMGVVSASDDIASNDTISQTNADDSEIQEISHDSSENNDVLSYSDDNSVVKSNDDSEDLLGTYSSGSVEIELREYIDVTETYEDIGHVYDDNGLKGTVTLTVDGKSVFTKKYTSGKSYSCYISTHDVDFKKIGYGYHNVKLSYNDGKVKSDSRSVNFVDVPYIDYPSIMYVGENNGITIDGDSILSGTATLFFRDIVGYDEYNEPIYKKGNEFTSVKIVNGHGWIPLDKLTNGSHSFQLEYKFGTYEDVDTFKITVKNNSPEFKSSLSATTIPYGNSITVKLTGPKSSGYVEIYIDNRYAKSAKFGSGSIQESISGLSLGNHRVTIQYSDDSDLFFSKTYNVVVEHAIKLKLTKVKVKKSAKKLVIKATLKIDGKVAKSKKLKFKFNKKTYSAKTDKKGIAKITVKKSVLKKLKKGKKVTYQVTYGKVTVKKTVKVKK